MERQYWQVNRQMDVVKEGLLNLIFSLFVEFSDLPVERQSAIHHWVALSLCDLLKKIGVSPSIKWPNDILTSNGKIAGILIENSLSSDSVKHSIIGIGLNVNQTEFGDLKATSIKLEIGNFSNVTEIAFMLINELNLRFEQLKKGNFDVLKHEYHERLWGMNQEVFFVRNGVEEKGVILGTDELGKLELQTQKGVEQFDLKEVKFLIDNERMGD
jgi:BirA family biotin operon repressor/biotin-[acetyl-CoA-carboxylase] ligase